MGRRGEGRQREGVFLHKGWGVNLMHFEWRRWCVWSLIHVGLFYSNIDSQIVLKNLKADTGRVGEMNGRLHKKWGANPCVAEMVVSWTPGY